MHCSRTLSRTAFHRTASPTPAVALLLAVGLAQPATGASRTWSAGDGFWLDPTNWTLGFVPEWGDDVWLGSLAAAQNAHVLVNPEAVVVGGGDLHILNGVTLDLNGTEWASFGEVSISGAGSTMIVRPGPPGWNIPDFQSGLHLGAGSHFQLADDPLVKLYDDSASSGTISGRGRVVLESVTPFRNDGVIAPSNNGGLELTSSIDTAVDLDGLTGSGQLLLTTPFSRLSVQTSALTDSFGGTIFLGTGSLLTMDLDAGWTADAQSTINVASGMPGAAAQIDGAEFTLGGAVNIGGAHGALRILAETAVVDGADVFLGADDALEFDGKTTLEGGVFELADGARIDFDGPTHVEGGAFSMVGNSTNEGVVRFNSTTTWSGESTFDGVVRQVGDASTGGGLGIVINATTLDMDGNGSTHWAINAPLVVNAGALDLLGSQIFDGSLEIAGGFAGALAMHLTDPTEAWIMAGSMELAGAGGVPVTRIAGSHMIVTGDLHAVSGLPSITADATLAAGSAIDIADGVALRVRGATIVESGAVFAGTGMLQNGLGGTMLLESGAALGQIGLINNATLGIGESGPGIAAVDSFQSTASALWSIDIGGYAAGTEHDMLLVMGGPAEVDGTLAVELSDLGAGTFVPQIGDEFTILIASGGVSGAFGNSPVSLLPGGVGVHWSVIYNPNSVVLRVDHIVPTPGALAIAGLSSLMFVRRFRGR